MRGYHPFNAKKPCFDEFLKDFGSFFIPNITGDHAGALLMTWVMKFVCLVRNFHLFK